LLDELLATTPRADSRFRQQFLKTYQHSKW
jgi:hypothetical protein